MKNPAPALLCLLATVAPAALADAPRDYRERWWAGDFEEYWNGPCEVKLESKPGEFKREVKCKDGIGATWRGEWKREFRDGPCRVKIEASREDYKEEVKCERR